MRHTFWILLSLLFLCSGCPETSDDDSAGDDDTGDDDTGDDDTGDDDTEGSDVVPPYAGEGGWTDCVLDDGEDDYDSSGAACEPGEPCIMVGLLREFATDELTSCDGVTAEDTLDAFEWDCREDGGGVVLYTTDLQVTLYDLIDAGGLSWRPIQLIVDQDGSEVVRSAEGVWWDNDILALPDNDGGGLASLDGEDTIYTVAADTMSDGYQIDADGVALTTGDWDLHITKGPGKNCASATGDEADADSTCLVAGNGLQCLWLEGNYGGGDADRTILLGDTHASVLYDLSAWDSVDAVRFVYGSSFNAVVDFWIGYAEDDGLVFDASHHNWAAHGLVEEVGGDGMLLRDADGNWFYSISSEMTGDDGWDLEFSHDNVIDTCWAYGNAEGFQLEGSTQNLLFNTESGWDWHVGLELVDGANDNLFIDTRGREHGGHGVLITDSTGNTFFGVRLMMTGIDDYDAWLMYGADRTTVVDAQISSAGGAGFYMYDSADCTVVELLAAWTGDDGFHASDGTEGLTLHQVTAVGNDEDGIELHNYKGTIGSVVSGVVSAGNYENGYNVDHTNTLRFHDVAACHNSYSGFDLEGMSDTSFHGYLWVGDNWDFDCESQFSKDPGVVHDTCANSGGSDATLITGVDLSSTFAGPLASDEPSNDDDVNGLAAWDDIDDWLSFENIWRGYGPEGNWPDEDYNTGPCHSGNDCRIWDWRLDSGDAVFFDVHGTFVDGQDCPASVHGDVAVTDFQTSPNTYLLHAVELIFDEIGDQDGLCETGEACLYMASPGAYVGDGEHAAVECTFTDGTVSGVTMYRMELWGA